MKENGLTLKKKAKSRQYPTEIIMDADYADDLVLLTDTPTQIKSLQHSLIWFGLVWFGFMAYSPL